MKDGLAVSDGEDDDDSVVGIAAGLDNPHKPRPRQQNGSSSISSVSSEENSAPLVDQDELAAATRAVSQQIPD